MGAGSLIRRYYMFVGDIVKYGLEVFNRNLSMFIIRAKGRSNIFCRRNFDMVILRTPRLYMRKIQTDDYRMIIVLSAQFCRTLMSCMHGNMPFQMRK